MSKVTSDWCRNGCGPSRMLDQREAARRTSLHDAGIPAAGSVHDVVAPQEPPRLRIDGRYPAKPLEDEADSVLTLVVAGEPVGGLQAAVVLGTAVRLFGRGQSPREVRTKRASGACQC